MYTTNLKTENITTEQAFEILKAGNERFINNIGMKRDLLQQVTQTKYEQKPFAAILSCMDSRAPVELIFDQGIGDIFSVRIAGNIISENILGSLEYAVEVVGSKLIVVMGHTGCGAIKGACDGVDIGNIGRLLEKIKPSVEKENTELTDRTSANKEFVNKVAAINVHHSIDEMLAQSDIIRKHHDDGSLKIVAAMYDVATGRVHFSEDKLQNEHSYAYYL
jgi:carbonic anhydrase